ncbi:hypothetical protein [Trichloromonas sp.]|uniref:hypothetical protein n=1 Tax=Trichloromonas sp. TaxID=3069249 RepID=UPI003D81B611
MKKSLVAVLLLFSAIAYAEGAYWYVSSYEIFRTISGGNEARVTVVMSEETTAGALFAPSKVCGVTTKGKTVCSSVSISEPIAKGERRSFLVKLPATAEPLTSAWFE